LVQTGGECNRQEEGLAENLLNQALMLLRYCTVEEHRCPVVTFKGIARTEHRRMIVAWIEDRFIQKVIRVSPFSTGY
jgi:hypothetical protein